MFDKLVASSSLKSVFDMLSFYKIYCINEMSKIKTTARIKPNLIIIIFEMLSYAS